MSPRSYLPDVDHAGDRFDCTADLGGDAVAFLQTKLDLPAPLAHQHQRDEALALFTEAGFHSGERRGIIDEDAEPRACVLHRLVDGADGLGAQFHLVAHTVDLNADDHGIAGLKPEQYDPFEVQIPIDVGEQCVLFENFKKHQESRKRIIPSLATKKLKERAGVMHEIISEHIDSWKIGEEINFPRVVGDMTLDIICYTLFDQREGERKERYKELILGWLITSL